MEEVKEKIWYKTEDFFGNSVWYNYFIEIGDRVKYYSLGPDLDKIYYIEEEYDEFVENIIEAYELTEIYNKLGEILREIFN